MKIFRKDYKVNFVDENNVFVGWDDTSNCCERHDWNFEPAYPPGEELASYSFDPTFFEEEEPESSWESGGLVRFRATNPEGRELFLTLSNYHNGYYSHGFAMYADGVTLHSGCL